MNREQYEDDLAKRQEEHLKRVRGIKDQFWKPCYHDNCTQCHGTFVKLDGSRCIHMLYCDCPKCQPITVIYKNE